jgi:choline-sulfatase
MRRFFVCLLLLASLLPSASADDRRPNVLIIVGDDHRAEAIGAYGNKIVKTPNLDRLAESGAKFDRAYCNSPLCTPSRQSFLTGQYPHAVGVTLLNQALSEEACTLATRLREAGYKTGAFGKMHFNSDKTHGFEVYARPEQFWKGHGQRGAKPLPEGMEFLGECRPFQDPARVWLNASYRPTGRYDDEMPDTWYAQQAIEFMMAHKAEPFYIEIGFHQPHCPFQFPVEFARKLDPRKMPVPEPGAADADQIPKVFADLTREEKQGIIASYYTAVAYLDENIGRVVSAMEELDLAENTLVIYLGDNGYHLGEHGRFEKHCFYERAVRIPLIMSYPDHVQGGMSTKALVEGVDIVPTVLDYLGLLNDPNTTSDRALHGISLRRILEGHATSVREAVLSEYQPTQEAMVRIDRYKLIYRTGSPNLDWMGYEPVKPTPGRAIWLYDLEADPEEMRNVAEDEVNRPIVSTLLDSLVDWYRRIPPKGERIPADLSRADLLDWAIAPRNVPEASKPANPGGKP